MNGHLKICIKPGHRHEREGGGGMGLLLVHSSQEFMNDKQSFSRYVRTASTRDSNKRRLSRTNIGFSTLIPDQQRHSFVSTALANLHDCLTTRTVNYRISYTCPISCHIFLFHTSVHFYSHPHSPPHRDNNNNNNNTPNPHAQLIPFSSLMKPLMPRDSISM